MNYISRYLLKITLVVSVFLLQIGFASAVCPGTYVMSWAVTGAYTSCPKKDVTSVTPGSDKCQFFGATSPMSVTLDAGESCSVAFQCENYGSNSNLATASLTVTNQASCCNTGSQVGLPDWNGTTCVNVTGNITARTCSITAGNSSCNMNATWSTSGAFNPVTVERLYAGNSVILGGTANSGNVSLVFTPPGTYALGVYHDGVQLASSTFTASCAGGTSWHAGSGQCITNVAIGTFTLTSPTIYPNNSTNLNWTGVTGGGTVREIGVRLQFSDSADAETA